MARVPHAEKRSRENGATRKVHTGGAGRAPLEQPNAVMREINVPDAVFDSLRAHFEGWQIVESTATITGHTLVTRLLEALEIDPEHEQTGARR